MNKSCEDFEKKSYGQNKMESENRRLKALLELAKAQNANFRIQIGEQAEQITVLYKEVDRLAKSDSLNLRAIRRIQSELKAVQKLLREYQATNTAA